MTEVLQLPGVWTWAFDHLVGYCAAAIANTHGFEVRLRWTDSLESHVELSGVSWEDLASAVHQHAVDHSDGSWIQADGQINEQSKALFSPRVPAMDAEKQREWFQNREEHIDDLTSGWQSLDNAFIGALGIPSYWSHNPQGDPLPDWGASRWEMKTRNRGEEFVGNRLRKLATAVANRTPSSVERGLRGQSSVDEVGANKPDSRTPTGLMPPRATDNAQAWCALWGLSLFSVIPMQYGASATTGHVGPPSEGLFYLPLMTQWWPLGRLRTVLCSQQLKSMVDTVTQPNSSARRMASQWLLDRGVIFVAAFPIYRGGSKSAPERWAGIGHRTLLEI